MIAGREVFYTSTQDILFDNTMQQITFLYEKGGDFILGDHTVEIYADEDLIGSKTFTVK
jgi:cell division protein ZapB